MNPTRRHLVNSRNLPPRAQDRGIADGQQAVSSAPHETWRKLRKQRIYRADSVIGGSEVQRWQQQPLLRVRLRMLSGPETEAPQQAEAPTVRHPPVVAQAPGHEHTLNRL